MGNGGQIGDGMGDVVGKRRAAIVDTDARIAGGEQHGAARFEVIWVVDRPEQVAADQRNCLVTIQVAASVALFVGAGFNGVYQCVESGAGGDLGGTAMVSSGSRMAMSGFSSSPQAQTFIFSLLEKTEMLVTSDPVPAVVGMAIIGSRLAGSGVSQS